MTKSNPLQVACFVAITIYQFAIIAMVSQKEYHQALQLAAHLPLWFATLIIASTDKKETK